MEGGEGKSVKKILIEYIGNRKKGIAGLTIRKEGEGKRWMHRMEESAPRQYAGNGKIK